MAIKDPEVRRAKASEINKRYYLKHRDRINAEHRERWPAYYAVNRAKKLAAWRARYDKQKLAGRQRPERCEICGDLPGKRALSFDHSHQNGHFRGWICGPCNVVLGHVKDDTQRLRKLIAYLERTAENASPQMVIPGI